MKSFVWSPKLNDNSEILINLPLACELLSQKWQELFVGNTALHFVFPLFAAFRVVEIEVFQFTCIRVTKFLLNFIYPVKLESNFNHINIILQTLDIIIFYHIQFRPSSNFSSTCQCYLRPVLFIFTCVRIERNSIVTNILV